MESGHPRPPEPRTERDDDVQSVPGPRDARASEASSDMTPGLVAAWPNPSRQTGLNGHAFDRFSIVLPFSAFVGVIWEISDEIDAFTLAAKR